MSGDVAEAEAAAEEERKDHARADVIRGTLDERLSKQLSSSRDDVVAWIWGHIYDLNAYDSRTQQIARLGQSPKT